MFSLKKKLEPELKEAMNYNYYNHFRVIVKCNSLFDKVEKKITSMKCTLIRSFPELNCLSAILSARSIERLIEYPEISYIALDKYAFLCGKKVIENKPNFKIQELKKKIDAIGTVFVGKSSISGNNITVGLIDSGTFPHDDLTRPSNRIIKFVDLLNNYTHEYDDFGHGTFMAGLIAGNGFSSKGIVKGTAPRSNIFSIKAFNKSGKAFISDILYALKILLDNSKEFNIKVFCLPFEVFCYDNFILELFNNYFEKAVKNKISIVVPSGSNSMDTASIRSIATLSSCITVNALEKPVTSEEIEKPVYNYTGKIKKPDLSSYLLSARSLNSPINFIPEIEGHKCYPPNLKEAYTTFNGTSCATGEISGICALLYEFFGDVYMKDILSLLKLCSDKVEINRELTGEGIININKIYSILIPDE